MINIFKKKVVIIIMEYNFENIKLLLNIKYYKNLINGCNKNNIESSYLENIRTELINKTQNNIQETECENNLITETEHISENIDYLYTKPWNKLNQIHKIIKIKEFINTLDIKEMDKDELKDELIELVKDKKKKYKINYDEDKGKIINIASLTFVDGKYKIQNC